MRKRVAGLEYEIEKQARVEAARHEAEAQSRRAEEDRRRDDERKREEAQRPERLAGTWVPVRLMGQAGIHDVNVSPFFLVEVSGNEFSAVEPENKMCPYRFRGTIRGETLEGDDYLDWTRTDLRNGIRETRRFAGTVSPDRQQIVIKFMGREPASIRGNVVEQWRYAETTVVLRRQS